MFASSVSRVKRLRRGLADTGSEKDPLPADIDMTTEVPLSHFVRAPALCRELLHQTSAGRLVDYVTLASIELRIYCVMVVRSEEHGEAK